MGMEAAFAKASAELGDVSALADELSLKKRTEVFEEAYMDIRNYMSAGRVAGYVVFGALTLFGIVVGLVAYFATQGVRLDINISIVSLIGAMMPFLTAAVAGFTFLGLTQETASTYPVNKKRAAWYTVAAALIVFGFFIMAITYFGIKIGTHYIPDIGFMGDMGYMRFRGFKGFHFHVVPVIAAIIPFVLPGIGILAYLILTEKYRLKPWAKNYSEMAARRNSQTGNKPVAASDLGAINKSIWIFAIGLFILLGFLIGFKYSWLVFVFAKALELLLSGIMSKRGTD
jgi:hypothetical protein